MFSNFDKPYFSLKDIEDGLLKCSSIKYAAYRTAAKLRTIQKASFMDKVPLRVISCVFEKHQLQQMENSVQLDQKEVEFVLSDIFFCVKKERDLPLDVDYVCRLMLNFLKDIFDEKNSNTVQVFSFKIGLTLLCEAKPREKYHYLFEQIADHNNCVSRRKLEIMLKKMTKLIEYLGEGLLFGSGLIPGTVESCFQSTSGSLGLSEDIFMNWLMQDPQLLVWLSTLYRLQISESVSHNAKCGICKLYPLVGLRYRCLRCLSFNMCQSCFFTGKLTKKHKLKHPVQEFCYPMTSQQSTKAFLLTLKNRLYKKDSKLQYLPALKGESQTAELLRQSTRFLDEMEISSRNANNVSRISQRRLSFKELQNIVFQLEKDSEKLISEIDHLCLRVKNSEPKEWQTHLKNCLMKHKSQVWKTLLVWSQVQRLKLLRSYLVPENPKAFIASTPMLDQLQRDFTTADTTYLSPIAVGNCKKQRETSGEKMMWDNRDLKTYGSNPSLEVVQSGNFKSKESFEVSDLPDAVYSQMESKTDERKLEPTVLLGGKTLRELESSSKEGLSWLYENKNETSGEDKVTIENEKTFQELQIDLKSILKKLQELSIVTMNGEDNEIETASGKGKKEIDMIDQVDSLFLDLIKGIEKLVGS